VFDGKNLGADGNASATIGSEIIEDDCSGAVHRFVEQMQIMVDFFKAIQIARLEINNKYRESVHDPFFATYEVTHLSPEEFALCPPVLLKLTTEFFAGPDKGKLIDILNAGIPIKVLVQLDDLFEAGGSTEGPAVTLGAQARLANMAAALNNVYVFQAPLSHASIIQPGFLRGLEFNGPALFSIYTGNREHHPSLSDYHSAAAATESRVFPSFTYDPSAGDTLAERVNITENPQPEKNWPTDTFSYATSQDGETEIEMGFTPADFLFCDIRLASHFWRVPPSKWHEEMIPLHEFLELNEESMGAKIPYLTTVNREGQLVRVVMTRVILTLVERCASQWQHFQELGGINNSFVRKALDEEKQRLEDDSQRAIDEAKRKYDAQLDRNLGDLTAVIVRRIVSQIVTGGGIGPQAPAPAAAAPGTPPQAPAEAAPKAAPAPAEAIEEEEDEAISLDNAYIDTPLCTSCDECTRINKNIFAYNENKQAFVKDPDAGTYEELVLAAEKCPVHIIHPGKPKNPNEPGLDKLLERAARFN
jgi:ferredoxin